MAGLLDFVLPAILSAGNSARRSINGLLSDPIGTVNQFVNNKNDQAGAFLGDVKQATQGKLAGLLGDTPTKEQIAADQRWTQAMAEGYNPAGMIVYHGSPHKFSKFDSSKIGTGEGAQAYGHGLYLAENPTVAQSYISAGGAKPTATPEAYAADIVGMMGGEQKALKHLQDILPPTGETTFGGESRDLIANAIKAVQSGAYKQNAGSLYKVDLPDEHIARMLDWDKPLSQQQKQAAALIKKDRPHLFSAGEYPDTLTLGSDLAARGIKSGPQDVYGHNPAIRYGVPAKHMTGQDYWHLFMRQTNNDAAAAANAMKALGFPGLRYLDGGSRAAGQGTSNFVVFPGNEGLLTIIERNGQRLP